MPRHIRNRFLILAVLTLAALGAAAPTFIGSMPGWWPKALSSGGMRLGLDLQGGMYLTLKVDVQKAIQHHELSP